MQHRAFEPRALPGQRSTRIAPSESMIWMNPMTTTTTTMMTMQKHQRQTVCVELGHSARDSATDHFETQKHREFFKSSPIFPMKNKTTKSTSNISNTTNNTQSTITTITTINALTRVR
jgi:hypothetical protein